MSRNETHTLFNNIKSNIKQVLRRRRKIFIVYYVLILHMNVTIIMGTFTLIAAIAMMLFYISYLSAMAMAIKIARYECYIFFIFSLNYL